MERRSKRLTEGLLPETIVRKPSATAGLPSYRKGKRVDGEGAHEHSNEASLMERILERGNMN
jgi:hypothetical protein